MITPKRIISKNVKISRERKLPVSGISKVKVGDKVNFSDTVLEVELKGEVHILRLSQRLGIDPDSLTNGLLVKVGDDVKKGDLIFHRKSFISFFDIKDYSDVSGKVEFISPNSGHLGIRLASKNLELKAFIPGQVEVISNNRSIKIASEVSLLQGVVGYGGERVAEIYYIDNAINKNLDEDLVKSLNLSKPTILAGIKSVTSSGFEALVNSQVVGLIISSISSKDVTEILKTSALGTKPNYSDTNPVIVVIEGFGDIQLSEKANEILKRAHGKTSSINGLTQVRAGAIRPEVIIHEALSNEEMITEVTASFPKIGDIMRVVRGSYFGSVGEIIEIPNKITEINSGVQTHIAVLKIGSEQVKVSLANLESF